MIHFLLLVEILEVDSELALGLVNLVKLRKLTS